MCLLHCWTWFGLAYGGFISLHRAEVLCLSFAKLYGESMTLSCVCYVISWAKPFHRCGKCWHIFIFVCLVLVFLPYAGLCSSCQLYTISRDSAGHTPMYWVFFVLCYICFISLRDCNLSSIRKYWTHPAVYTAGLQTKNLPADNIHVSICSLDGNSSYQESVTGGSS